MTWGSWWSARPRTPRASWLPGTEGDGVADVLYAAVATLTAAYKAA